MADMGALHRLPLLLRGLPAGLDIPKLLSLYNEFRFDNASIIRSRRAPCAGGAARRVRRLRPVRADLPAVDRHPRDPKEFSSAFPK
jgi:hypothetical protein